MAVTARVTQAIYDSADKREEVNLRCHWETVIGQERMKHPLLFFFSYRA